MDSQFSTRPDGLAGNDGLGQMSTWYVFTALGFYPAAPGSDQYVIGRPFLDKAVLYLPNHKNITVLAQELSAVDRYVGAVTLDGNPLE